MANTTLPEMLDRISSRSRTLLRGLRRINNTILGTGPVSPDDGAKLDVMEKRSLPDPSNSLLSRVEATTDILDTALNLLDELSGVFHAPGAADAPTTDQRAVPR